MKSDEQKPETASKESTPESNRMKSWLNGLLIVAGTILLLGNTMERDFYTCSSCYSKKSIRQWGVVMVPLTPELSRVDESRFYHDFFPSDHVHSWRLAQGSPYLFFGTLQFGCAIGPGRQVNRLAWMYGSNPNFQAFIQVKLKDGSLTKSNLIALASVPVSGGDAQQQKAMEELLKEFDSRR
jgi:hypothetical protein